MEGKIVVRILKMVQPVEIKPGSIVNPLAVPLAGDFLRTRNGQPWHYKIPEEKPVGPRTGNRWALRLLKENPGVSWTMF